MILQVLRRHRSSLFIGMVAIFLIGIFVGLGGYVFTSRDVSESVAVVGDAKIPYLRFNQRVYQYVDMLRQRGTDLTDAQVAEVKQAMLRDMIVDEILSQEALKLGLEVTDLELASSIRNNPSFHSDGAFNPNLYFQTLRQGLRMSPEDYEREQKKAMLSSKLKQLLFTAAKLMPGEVLEEYRKQKGSTKDFEKNRASVEQQLEQARALDMINFFLRHVTAGMDIRTFLAEREQGR